MGRNYGLEVVMLFGPFIPFALIAVAGVHKFWQDRKRSFGRFHLVSSTAGLIASIVTLAAVILATGGMLAGYDAEAGGAFNPGPNNWGMNIGLALGVIVAPVAWLLFGISSSASAFVRWWYGKNRGLADFD